MRLGLAALGLGLAACATPARPAPQPAPPAVVEAAAVTPDEALAVREVVTRFVDAAEGGRFDAALALLAEPVKGRYSAQRLAADFAADPSAKARLAAVRAALRQGVTVRAEEAVLPLGHGRQLRAVKEQGAWRIAALEE